jgi:hypothetical protein
MELTVRQAFEAEPPSLMDLPMDASPVDARVEVQVAKTPYVRLDLNDYRAPRGLDKAEFQTLCSLDWFWNPLRLTRPHFV